jgi:hypothetical protein
MWQPARAWFGLVACIIIILFNGWRAFFGGKLDRKEFAGSYLAPILFLVLYIGNKSYDAWWEKDGWGFTAPANTQSALFGARSLPRQARNSQTETMQPATSSTNEQHPGTTLPPTLVTGGPHPGTLQPTASNTGEAQSETTQPGISNIEEPQPETTSQDNPTPDNNWPRMRWLRRQFVFWFT